jgi:hypothetical protein
MHRLRPEVLAALRAFTEHGEMQKADLVIDASIAARSAGSSPGFLVTAAAAAAAGDDFQRRTFLQQNVLLILLVPLHLGPTYVASGGLNLCKRLSLICTTAAAPTFVRPGPK